MDLPISSLMIPAGCVILIWSALWLLYQIPIRLNLSFSKDQNSFDFFLDIGWGPLRIRFLRGSTGWQVEGLLRDATLISRPVQPDKYETEPVKEITDSGEKVGLRDLIRFIPGIRRLLSELIRHITLDKISADVTFGAGDPATTGVTFGYFQALRPMMTTERCSIVLTPVFDKMILEGTLTAGILITCPLGILIRGGRVILPELIQMKRGVHA